MITPFSLTKHEGYFFLCARMNNPQACVFFHFKNQKLMKRNIMLLCAALVIFVSACHWFNSSSSKTPGSIVGVWVLDSLQANDTSKSIGQQILLAGIDSGNVYCQFNKDSSFQSVIGKDSTKGKFAISKDTVSIQEFSLFHSYAYSIVGDSALLLTDVDSTRFLFHRKL